MALVYMMMSGGVDSSVAALELASQGYQVKGVFMKCWSLEALENLGLSQDLYGCFWEDDVQDASLVAKKLGIEFEVWDLQDEYRQKVVDYMIFEYKAGRTPNPDVMCNSMIKFGVFYERAILAGADFVATGHYAKMIENTVFRAGDHQKDQSYFLWGIQKDHLQKVLLPIGEYASKAEVRKKAEFADLITAAKPDSQGLCFVGTTPLRELLIQTLGQKTGNIVDTAGKVLGQHPGAYLYTVGQREKLGLSGGPWYVSKIDVEANQVIVAHQDHSESLFTQKLIAKKVNWQVEPELESFSCLSQVRYRQPPQECRVEIKSTEEVEVFFTNPVKAVAVGQSVVFYDGDKLLGGGVIDSKE